MKRRRHSTSFWLYTGSIALHGGLAIGAVLLPKPKHLESVAIQMFEAKQPEAPVTPPPPPPPPKPPPPKREPPKPQAAPEAPPDPGTENAQPEPAAANAMDGFEDLGMAMGNGGGSGVAIPVPGQIARAVNASTQKAAPAPKETKRTVRALTAAPADACDEAPIKPKPKWIVKPAYSMEARSAQIEGVVRVEITIDEQGTVIRARVLKGLGYGLDEAAVAAVKQMTFEPGTRCGKAAVTTLSISMRFALGS